MHKKTYLALISPIIGLLIFSLNSAASTSSVSPVWRPFIAFAGGSAINSNAGQSANFPANATSFSYYDYVTDQTTNASFIFNGSAGVELILNPLWLLQVDLAYYTTDPFKAKGTVIQGVDVSSQEQYTYN